MPDRERGSTAADRPRRIGQVALTTRDVDRATAFYRDVVGLEFLFAAPPGLAFLRCGGTRLMLAAPESPEHDHPASLLYYDVEDLGAAHRRIAAAGAEVVAEPHVVHRTDAVELRIGFYRDSEGNVFALMNESAAPGGEPGGG